MVPSEVPVIASVEKSVEPDRDDLVPDVASVRPDTLDKRIVPSVET